MEKKILVRVSVTYRGTVTVEMTRAEYEEAHHHVEACTGASPDDFAWWDRSSLGVKNLFDGELDAVEEAPWAARQRRTPRTPRRRGAR